MKVLVKELQLKRPALTKAMDISRGKLKVAFYKYLSKSSESSINGWKKMIGKESNFSLSLFI